MYEDQITELSQRARYLTSTRGSECTFDNGEPFSWKELHLDTYSITLTEDGRLEVRTGFVKEMLVFTQCETSSLGRSDHPELLDECLEVLRQRMVLEDLADV